MNKEDQTNPRSRLLRRKGQVAALVILIAGLLVASTIGHFSRTVDDAPAGMHPNAILFNEQIRLLLTDEVVGIGNYTDDALEPTGWELSPAIFWDCNLNGTFDANESIGHSLSPSIHFAYEGQPRHFWPLHQSVLQNPGDANVTASGWISAPNIYRAEVEDAEQLITLETKVSVLNGNHYFTQEFNVTSTASTSLTDVHLIAYVGLDINGHFDDVAFTDPAHNNMLKAYDNKTGVWFGVSSDSSASGFEVSIWNDGPSEGEDLWQHTLDNSLTSTTNASGDVESSMQFYLDEIQPGQSKIVTLYCSFAKNESGLYVPSSSNHDVAIINFTTTKMGCHPVETVGHGQTVTLTVTMENQGNATETFDVTTYANTTQIASYHLTLNPAENQTIDLIWDTTSLTKGNYSIKAEADQVPEETDTTDNAFTYGWILVTLPGDIDGDHDVDIFDIVRMAGVYGIHLPDLRYDPNCDVDGDGDIDIFDIVLAAGHYGENW